MRKAILLVAAIIMIGLVTSCQKNSTPSSYTCSCNLTLVTGVYSRDTTETVTYPANTSSTDARTQCNTQQNTLQSLGNKSVSCVLIPN